MDLQVTDRVAVITGASSGIGLHTAKQLQFEGVKLLLTDMPGVNWSDAESVLGDFELVEADLTQQDECQSVVDRAIHHFGGCHILVHSAGITGEKGHPLEMSDEAWREAWDIDFLSAVRISRAAIPEMRKAQWGRAVFITSENAVQPYADEAVYNTAKAALGCFVKNLSKVEGKHGVLINSVAPAFIETPMTNSMMEQRAEEMGIDVEEAVASFLDQERPGITAKRRGKPEEVAAIITMLCSERASFVNGSNYRVDCGSVMTADY
ncbi:SDR family NAD(P)-dependent oxidoreductase [Neorhodopirellula pilleata]|uniref:3-oxoacyl-[acyl-carrier-protein] reductase FabG n=1 Tax=Neorhodopirellula pilleata TaxID=2714738 RepID=A0A5C6AWA1_9BACT|nr:SDR family oxidoreductase [Neorhodopirellula pilleata]TWU04020.1 3-oxoacyl-[acyl-carrier-protein] reductase FabG [Neorhodopirellula pilleata]